MSERTDSDSKEKTHTRWTEQKKTRRLSLGRLGCYQRPSGVVATQQLALSSKHGKIGMKPSHRPRLAKQRASFRTSVDVEIHVGTPMCAVCLSCVCRSSYNEPFAVMTKARFVHLPPPRGTESLCCCCCCFCCFYCCAESEKITVFSFPNVLLLNFSNCLGQVLYSRNKTDLVCAK